MVSTSVANAFGKKADLVRIAWYLICAVQLCLSISAIYAASLDNSGMKDVSVAAIWSTILLFGNSILGFLYFVRPAASEKRENPLMFGFWLGFQAMLSPTFLILACFFFSFSELYTEVRLGFSKVTFISLMHDPNHPSARTMTCTPLAALWALSSLY